MARYFCIFVTGLAGRPEGESKLKIKFVDRPEGKALQISGRKEVIAMPEIFHWVLHGTLVLVAILLISFMRDGLTGLWVRRVYEMVYPFYRRKGGYMLLIDLDDLGIINDKGGHPAGDVALRTVAQVIRRFGCWLSFRFGGDEFALLLPGADKARAEKISEQICLVCGAVGFSVSIGFGQWEQDADEALYRAKAAGRNCVRGPTALAEPR